MKSESSNLLGRQRSLARALTGGAVLLALTCTYACEEPPNDAAPPSEKTVSLLPKILPSTPLTITEGPTLGEDRGRQTVSVEVRNNRDKRVVSVVLDIFVVAADEIVHQFEVARSARVPAGETQAIIFRPFLAPTEASGEVSARVQRVHFCDDSRWSREGETPANPYLKDCETSVVAPRFQGRRFQGRRFQGRRFQGRRFEGRRTLTDGVSTLSLPDGYEERTAAVVPGTTFRPREGEGFVTVLGSPWRPLQPAELNAEICTALHRGVQSEVRVVTDDVSLCTVRPRPTFDLIVVTRERDYLLQCHAPEGPEACLAIAESWRLTDN